MSQDLQLELQRLADGQDQVLALATELKEELLGKDGIKERVNMHHAFITMRQKIEMALIVTVIGMLFTGGGAAAIWIIVKMHT